MHVVACLTCGRPLAPDALGLTACHGCSAAASPGASAPSSDALAWSPAGDAARVAMTDEGVLSLLREHFAGIDGMYLCPSIPGKRELGARRVHARHLPSDERVLALFDDTVFGSGDEGFLVTARRLCWKNASDRPQMIEWQHVDADRMYADRQRLAIGGHSIDIGGDESTTFACEETFHVLAFSASTAAVTSRSGVVLAGDPEQLARRASDRPTFRPSRPPATLLESAIAPRADLSAPSFACWYCRAPVAVSAVECQQCYARPTPHGWLRTG